MHTHGLHTYLQHSLPTHKMTRNKSRSPNDFLLNHHSIQTPGILRHFIFLYIGTFRSVYFSLSVTLHCKKLSIFDHWTYNTDRFLWSNLMFKTGRIRTEKWHSPWQVFATLTFQNTEWESLQTVFFKWEFCFHLLFIFKLAHNCIHLYANI